MTRSRCLVSVAAVLAVLGGGEAAADGRFEMTGDVEVVG